MTASTFMVDKRELNFILFEYLRIQDLSQYSFFTEHSKESLSDMMDSGIDMCEKVIGPLNKSYDRIGCTYYPEDKTVKTPPGTKEAYKTYVNNGFMTISDVIEANGLQAPSTLAASFQEIFSGANQAFTMLSGLTKSGSHVLWKFGSSWMQNIVSEKIALGKWTATMCLTEAAVGSAVGDITTTATRMQDGTFRLKGIKQWISGGENDFSENIIHLVMARIEGAPEGIEGVSLFLVPKYKFDKTTLAINGSNDVFCISLEEKMGIHGNPTCLMSFGDQNNCDAFLVGEENKGITSMFLMMNEARIGVGLQAIGQASTAFLNAETYAKERLQGIDFTVKKHANQPRVPIVEHPDVKRMLLRQRSIVEGGRALCYVTTHLYDYSAHHESESERKKFHGFVELLTPICKAWCTSMGFDSIVESIQTYGGYGYVKDYPVEQNLRDAKITSLYEGTNGIQALDFVGRKMRLEEGEVLLGWLERHTNFIDENREHTSLGQECHILEEYIGTFLEATMLISERGKAKDRKGAILNAVPLLMAFGHITVCGLLLEQAHVCDKKLQLNSNCSMEDKRFYRNKIRTAKFFTYNVLTEAKAFLQQVMSDDRSCLDFEFNEVLPLTPAQHSQAREIFTL